MLFVAGSKVDTVTVGSGRFFCPECGSEQPYRKKETYKYFTLYWMKVARRELLDSYIECKTCRETFKPEVLVYEPPSPEELLILRAREDLRSGTPFLTVVAKIKRLGQTAEAAEEIVNKALGEKYRWCASCEQAYHLDIRECLYCGEKMPPVSDIRPHK